MVPPARGTVRAVGSEAAGGAVGAAVDVDDEGAAAAADVDGACCATAVAPFDGPLDA